MIHACIHTYVHTYIHTYIHTYVHTYIHTCIRTNTHVYVLFNMDAGTEEYSTHDQGTTLFTTFEMDMMSVMRSD
jgi:hypothetical protein